VEIYPAVDVRGGRVAHVRTGNALRPSVYGDDPERAVSRLIAEGTRWIHLVDLDHAYGTGSNRDVLRALLGASAVRAQVGGGLGTEDSIDDMVAWGAARVVIGCAAAATAPELVRRLVQRHGPERLAVAVDTTAGRVTPRGRTVALDLTARDLAQRVYDLGIRTVVYTDVRRDGTLTGPDVHGAAALAGIELAVIVSGGVGSLDHLRAVRAASLAGSVVGRALHEGSFTLREALACAAA
jgi:phosphoribosylformimino-5-aminoimidazole carboxamide ribotide isomerase